MKRIYSLLLVLGVLASGAAVAQWTELSAGNLDSRTLRTQAKAESLYQRGDYKRAHFIYSHELARLGDKYAQYMTGYMYQMGQGVVEDPVRASAWYRIAAERRIPEFIAVRDQVLRALDDGQRARSDKLYVELRKEYSDLVIVMGLLDEETENLKMARTGSRLAVRSGSVTVVDPRTGMQTSAEIVRKRDLRIIQARLDFITSRLDMDSISADNVDKQLDALWERVRDHVSVVDDESEGLYAAP